jgi:hypothetical protein
MLLQFAELELDDLQGLNPAIQLVALRHLQVCGNFALTFSQRFRQKANIVVSVFDTVKWSLQTIVQGGNSQ